MNLSCMIVDDEPMSRRMVRHFVDQTNFLDLKHECESAIEASSILDKEEVDILLLDIEMPEMSGLDLVKDLDKSFEIILITSGKDYAVEAFENSVTDFLVKPFEYNRFLKAVRRAKDNIKTLKNRIDTKQDIFVKADSKIFRIGFKDILFVEALADYVIIKTTQRQYIVHSTMKGMEKRLPSNSFARVHRSYIVNINLIDTIEDLSIRVKEKSIPVGVSFKDRFLQKLNFL